MANIRDLGHSTPQGGAQVYGDAEAESLREDLELSMGNADSVMGSPAVHEGAYSKPYQLVTIAGLVLLAVLTLAFKLDIGFVAITIGLALSLMSPNLQKRAIGQVSWPEIVLITGVSTYVGVLESMGTINFVGHSVAGMTSPLIAALLLCFIGARRVGLRLIDGCPGIADPAGRAVPSGGHRRQRHRLHRGDGGRIDHRRCQPLLDQRRSGAGECAGGGPRTVLPPPDGLRSAGDGRGACRGLVHLRRAVNATRGGGQLAFPAPLQASGSVSLSVLI